MTALNRKKNAQTSCQATPPFRVVSSTERVGLPIRRRKEDKPAPVSCESIAPVGGKQGNAVNGVRGVFKHCIPALKDWAMDGMKRRDTFRSHSIAQPFTAGFVMTRKPGRALTPSLALWRRLVDER